MPAIKGDYSAIRQWGAALAPALKESQSLFWSSFPEAFVVLAIQYLCILDLNHFHSRFRLELRDYMMARE